MYFYPVYRYRNNSDATFVRVGSIRGFEGPYRRPGIFASLLIEAKKLFSLGADDVILLGPSPIAAFQDEVLEHAGKRTVHHVGKDENQLQTVLLKNPYNRI